MKAQRINILGLKSEQVKASPEEHSESRSRQFTRHACCYAPIRDLPAAFVYCCPVTILEWDSGHVFLLTPVTKLGSPVIHFSTPGIMIQNLSKPSLGRKVADCRASICRNLEYRLLKDLPEISKSSHQGLCLQGYPDNFVSILTQIIMQTHQVE